MSGVEVAGLVLGAFPVAIWALEQYRDVARMMGFWYEIRLEYQRSSNELKFHRLSFVRNLKRLLLPLVPDDAQLQRLISDPRGSAWNDPEIQKGLEARLQDSYGLYLEILAEMQRVMQELNKELAVDSDAVQTNVSKDGSRRARVPATSRFRRPFDQSNRSYQVFRVKFSMGERTRTRLFTELQTYNDRLEKLMASSDVVSELEEVRQKQLSTTSKPASTAMSKFWYSADKLYRALLEAWNCGCRDHHCAHLILQHRAPSDRDFHLRLEAGTQGVDKKNAWSTCSVTLKMLDQLPQETAVAEQVGSSINEAELSASVSISTPQHRMNAPGKAALPRIGKARKKVHIAAPSSPPVAQTMTRTLTVLTKESTAVTMRLPNTIPTPDETLLTDLCEALDAEGVPSAAKSTVIPLGYLAPKESEIRFAIHLDHPITPPVQPHINLSQLLLGELKQTLTRRQRYRLSLTLASSFVQLKDTAWQQTPWDKRNVYLFTSLPSSTPVVESPFIVSRFRQEASPCSPATHGHDVAGIASLGILLLELCFGHAIEHHPSWLMLPSGVVDDQVRAGLSLIAALEWLKEVNDEAGADYTDAVEWCLAGCRTLASDRSWRKLMVERVVEPLQRCYKYLE
ncbi:Prion-inhibition and propagation HeLo domain-containing protein [Madurella fahalii]|uniref:Prion-inhibition and propagation HeLo domain-containing protein n=1 Tax=Madurella fahalii TaxID=1157608 RepID=A0ABQ0G611_9PEZI